MIVIEGRAVTPLGRRHKKDFSLDVSEAKG